MNFGFLRNWLSLISIVRNSQLLYLAAVSISSHTKKNTRPNRDIPAKSWKTARSHVDCRSTRGRVVLVSRVPAFRVEFGERSTRNAGTRPNNFA